jgi:hypothetical protein
MKTPEELAVDYALNILETRILDRIEREEARLGFLAGYQAAKDQPANTGKLIKPTDTLGKEELNCMIAYFENEDYKISVMVPGILPKDDGGELVCGCGLIVYDIRKKVV